MLNVMSVIVIDEDVVIHVTTVGFVDLMENDKLHHHGLLQGYVNGARYRI